MSMYLALAFTSEAKPSKGVNKHTIRVPKLLENVDHSEMPQTLPETTPLHQTAESSEMYC